MICRVVQPRHELEQRRGGSRECILADGDSPRAHGRSHRLCRRRIPLRLLPHLAGRRGRIWLPPARTRPNDRSVTVVRRSSLRRTSRRSCIRQPSARIDLDDRSIAAARLGEGVVGHEATHHRGQPRCPKERMTSGICDEPFIGAHSCSARPTALNHLSELTPFESSLQGAPHQSSASAMALRSALGSTFLTVQGRQAIKEALQNWKEPSRCALSRHRRS